MGTTHDPGIQIFPIIEARFGLDGGAMFGIIPRTLWSRTNPPDEENRIELTTRCLLVQHGDRNILVDVGIGDRWSARERDIYAIREADPQLRRALATHALTPEKITDVILTHLHFDHAGGIAWLDDSGVLRPSFPNATHHVQRRNWSWAHTPSARDQGSYRAEDLAIFAHPEHAPALNLIDGIAEIIPGVDVLPHHGHTFGMQVVLVRTPHTTFAYLADLIPTTSHLRDPYVMGYDIQPLVTVREKRALLFEAARHDWVLIFGHDPSQDMVRVEIDARGRPTTIPVSAREVLAASP